MKIKTLTFCKIQEFSCFRHHSPSLIKIPMLLHYVTSQFCQIQIYIYPERWDNIYLPVTGWHMRCASLVKQRKLNFWTQHLCSTIYVVCVCVCVCVVFHIMSYRNYKLKVKLRRRNSQDRIREVKYLCSFSLERQLADEVHWADNSIGYEHDEHVVSRRTIISVETIREACRYSTKKSKCGGWMST
jgi:hypothetical protein